YGFAINNQLISYYHIGDFVETLRYAELVKEHDKSSQEDIALAHLYAGKASLATKKPADALSAFTMAASMSKTITGAEAKSLVAEPQLKANENGGTMASAFDISYTFASYDYWVAKGLILMADA